MIKETLPDRLTPLLEDETSREYMKGCLSELRSNMKDAQVEMRTLLISMLLLLALFELLARSAISEVTIGPVKVNDLSLVLKALPVLLAFTYNSVIAKMILIMLIRGMHRYIIKHIALKLFESDIDLFLFPPSTFYILNLLGPFVTLGVTPTFVIGSLFTLILFLSVIFLPIGAEIYMFWVCFARLGLKDFMVWFSLVLSLILITQSFVYLILGFKIDPETEFSL